MERLLHMVERNSCTVVINSNRSGLSWGIHKRADLRPFQVGVMFNIHSGHIALTVLLTSYVVALPDLEFALFTLELTDFG